MKVNPPLQLRCLFLHGLESGVNGKKSQYLGKHFENVTVPDLQTGYLNFNSNSFLTSSIRNILKIFNGRWFEEITTDVLEGATEIVRISLENEPYKPDIIVASSMGGAIALECLRKGIIPRNIPLLLLAPALKLVILGWQDKSSSNRLQEWYESFRNSGEIIENITIIHGTLDNIVNIDNSRELCHSLGSNKVCLFEVLFSFHFKSCFFH